jgi:hypothetical protein
MIQQATNIATYFKSARVLSRKYVQIVLFLLCFLGVNMTSLRACDEASVNLVSVTPLGGGQTQYTFDICLEMLGLEGIPGWFSIDFGPNSVNVVSFSSVPGVIMTSTGDIYNGAIIAANDEVRWTIDTPFPAHGSNLLCFQVSITITGTPTSITMNFHDTYPGCSSDVPLPTPSPCDCASGNGICGGEHFCSSSVAEEDYDDPFSNATQFDFVPNLSATNGTTYQFCYEYTTGPTETSVGFVNVLGTNGAGCGFTRTYQVYQGSGCSSPLPNTTPADFGTSGFEYTVLPNTFYNFCVTITITNSSCLNIDDTFVWLYDNSPGGGGCGTCSSPCAEQGMGMVDTYDDRTYLSCWSPDCDIIGPATFTNCFEATADATGFLGFANQVSGPSLACLSRTWALTSGCGSPIANPVPNANGVASGFNPEYSGLTPGATYVLCVTYTLGGGALCVFDTFDEICIDAYGNDCIPPIAGLVANPTTICLGGSSSLTATGGGTYAWSNGLGTGAGPKTVSPMVTTTYTVTVTSTPGCTSTAQVTVTVTPLVTPTFTQLGPYCQNATPGTLPTSSNNSPPITGTWSPSTISTSTVGMQTYTFTPTAGQCATTATMTITITPPVTPTFTQLGPYCQNATPGTLSTSSNNTPPITGTWSPSTISTSTVGMQTYTFTPTAGQCATLTTMIITITAPVTPTFTQLGPYCQNATPGTLPTSSNNSPPITGTWSPSVISTTTVGTQTYTFTPSAGQCGTTTTMMITITAPVTPTFTQLGPYCQNETPGTLPTSSNNSPPITGTWSPSVISTTTVGTQTYTFTPAAGQCATTTTMLVTITAPVTPNFAQLGPYCLNAAPDPLPTSSNNSPPITGTWNPSVINTSIVGSTVYTFTPTAGQCATTTTMTVVISNSVVPTFDPFGPYCVNAMPGTLPSQSNNNINGTWSPSVINTSAPGAFTYTFTPSAGQCGVITTITIVITAPVTPTFTQLGPYCQNATPGTLPTSSNNSPPITGTWSPSVISTTTVGTQTYTFTPAAGQCGTTTTMMITITAPVTPTFTQLGPYCQNATPGTLPTSSTNSPPITGTWSPSVINTSTVGSQVYTFTPSAGQCATTTTMTIVITAPVTPLFTQLGPYCLNATPGTLPTSSNNTPPVTGTWSPSVINTGIVGSTVYTFTPNPGQCASITTMTVVVTNSITPTFTQLGPYCQNATPGILPTSSNNPIAIIGTWSPSVINTSIIGSTVYTFTPDPSQCATTTTMTIVVTAPPIPLFTQLGPYCQNTSPGVLPTSSNDSPPIVGTWSPSVINTSVVGSTVYTFTPTAGQCAATTTMTIVITAPPTTTFTQLGPYCQNAIPGVLPTSSNNTPPITGTWSPSVISTSTVGTQIYTFTPGAGQCGTVTTMSITITAPTMPTFTQLGPYCQNATPGVLPTSSTNTPPISGTWSPSVINTSTVGSQVYTFTPNAGECATQVTMTIVVTAPVLPTFDQLGPYCLNATPGVLPTSSTNTSPITGTWSPAVINTSVIGSTVYTFTPTVGQCASVTTMTIVVSNSVTPSFDQLGPFCLNSTPPSLAPTSDNGITGTWSPATISTSVAGSFVYTFTPNAGQCGIVTTMTIVITDSVTPTFTQLGPYCQNDTPGLLPLSSTNTPPITGTWSPSVISTSTVGTQVYTFTPAPGQCGTTTTMSITIIAPTTPTFTQLGPYCQNATPGNLPLVSNNTPAITGTWSPSVINTSTVGSQVYTFTPNPGQCASTTTMTIVITAPLTPTFTQLGPYCQNTSPGVLPSNSLNGVSGTWTPSIINTSIIGNTVYTFTPSIGQCASVTTMTITITAPPVPTFVQLGPYCQNEAPDVLPNSSTNTPPITGSWNPAVINTSVIGSNVYTFTPTAGQCGTTSDMVITVLSGATSVVTDVTNTACGQSNGQVTIGAVTGGVAPYTYNFNNLGFSTTTTFINLASGSYPLVIQDANGCIFNTFVNVSNTSGPTDIITSVVNATCGINNGTLTLGAVTGGLAPYNYSFNSGPFNNTTFYPNLSAGTYSVEVMDASGCIFATSVTVNNIPGPTAIVITTANATCGSSDGSVTLGAVTGGVVPYTYSFNGSGFTSITVYSNLSAGTYPVEVRDNSGCIFSTSATVIDNGGPTNMSLNSTMASCGQANGSITVSWANGVAPFNISGDLTQTNVTSPTVFNNLMAGIYNVTVTDANGCVSSASATVDSVGGPVTSNVSTNATCGINNGQVVISWNGGTGPFNITGDLNLANAVSPSKFANLAPGSYNLTVTDANGCTSMQLVSITGSSALTATPQTTDATCGQSNGSYTVTWSGGTGPYNISGGFTQINAISPHIFANVGSGTYTVTVTDLDGCTASVTASVGNGGGPVATASSTAASCGQSNGSVTVTWASGVGPFNITGDLTQTNATTPTLFNNVAAGQYNVTVTDANGCSSIASTTVTSAGGPTANTTITDATCGTDNGSITVTWSGGVGPFNMAGDLTRNNVSSPAVFSGLGAGMYNFTLTDNNNCSQTLMVTISMTPSLSIGCTAINVSQPNLSDGSIDITLNQGLAPFTISWAGVQTGSVQNISQNSYSILNLTSGQYNVTVTDANGCTDICQSTLNAPGCTIAAVATGTNSTCFGSADGTILLTVTGAIGNTTIVWSNPAWNGLSNITNAAPGSYSVTITDAANCVATESVLVGQPTPVTIACSANPVSGSNGTDGVSIININGGTPNYRIDWSGAQNGSMLNQQTGNFTITNLRVGQYQVTVTDNNGCSSTCSFEIEDVPCNISANVSATDVTCFGACDGGLFLTVSGGTPNNTIVWSNPCVE